MQLPDYITNIANQACVRIKQHHVCNISGSVRSGKKVMAFEIAKLLDKKFVLYIISDVEYPRARSIIEEIQKSHILFGYNQHFDLKIIQKDDTTIIGSDSDFVICDYTYRHIGIEKGIFEEDIQNIGGDLLFLSYRMPIDGWESALHDTTGEVFLSTPINLCNSDPTN